MTLIDILFPYDRKIASPIERLGPCKSLLLPKAVLDERGNRSASVLFQKKWPYCYLIITQQKTNGQLNVVSFLRGGGADICS